MKKFYSVLLALFIVIFAVAPAFAEQSSGRGLSGRDSHCYKKFTFIAVGDNLIHGMLYMQANDRVADGYDFAPAYENVRPLLSGYKLRFINQETLVNSKFAASTYPMFSSPAEVGHIIYDMGFRIISIANNHSYDKGAAGVSATLDFWRNMPSELLVVGLYTDKESDEIPVITQSGVDIAVLSYTELTNGLSVPDTSEAKLILTAEEDVIERQVRKAAEVADLVFVSVHFGTEDSHIINERQRELAAKLADWGADVIIGHHPHVIQGVEYVTGPQTGNTALVAYSLGNFISAQSQADQLIGSALTFEVVQMGAAKPIIRNVLVKPLVTHYGAGYSNIKVYPLSEYTDELAASHGVRSRFPGFNIAYIKSVFSKYIDSSFLAPELQ